MAFTRKMLKALGIEDDKIDQIMDAHVEVVDTLKEERDGYKSDAEKLPGVQKEFDTLKANGGSWQTKYEKEHADFEAYKKNVETKEAQSAKETAYRAILGDANLTEKGIEKAIKYADWNSMELESDGKLKDANDHLKAAREEWAEYVSNTKISGVNTPNPPANNGGGAMTKADILKIKDTAERQAAFAQYLQNQKGN